MLHNYLIRHTCLAVLETPDNYRL